MPVVVLVPHNTGTSIFRARNHCVRGQAQNRITYCRNSRAMVSLLATRSWIVGMLHRVVGSQSFTDVEVDFASILLSDAVPGCLDSQLTDHHAECGRTYSLADSIETYLRHSRHPFDSEWHTNSNGSSLSGRNPYGLENCGSSA